MSDRARAIANVIAAVRVAAPGAIAAALTARTLVALLLGVGTAALVACVPPWRALVVGTTSMPVGEQLLALLAGTGGALLSLLARLQRVAGPAASVGLLLTAVSVPMTIAWAAPAMAATALGTILVVVLPAAALGVAAAVFLRASGVCAVVELAWCSMGVLLAVWTERVWSWSPFGEAALAAVAMLAASAMLPWGLPAAAGGVGNGRGGLLIGALLASALAGTPARDASNPAAAVSVFAVTVLLAASVPVARRPRWRALAVVLGLLGSSIVAGSPASAEFALVAGAALWIGTSGSGDHVALARRGIWLAAGAGLALVAPELGWPPALPVAIAAFFALLPLRRRSLAVPLACAATVAVAVWRVSVPFVPAVPGAVVLAHAGNAIALYRPGSQEVALCRSGRDVDVAGPDHQHAALAAAVVLLLADPGGCVVLGNGTGRLQQCLDEGHGVPIVEPDAGARSLQAALAVIGPVQPRQPLVVPTTLVVGGRALLWGMGAGACTAIALGEPLLATRTRAATVDEHRALRHAVGDGAVVQSFLLDRTAPELLARGLAAAANVHPWCGVFVAGTAGVVCGLGRAPRWELAAARLVQLPAALRWRLHAAGISDLADLQAALLGTLRPTAATAACGSNSEPASRSPSAIAGNSDIVRTALEPLPADALATARLDLRSGHGPVKAAAVERLRRAVAEHPDGVLLARELQAAKLAEVERAIARVDPAQPGQVAAAAATAAQFCHLGCPSPVLQAALALRDRHGERVREPQAAAAAALALAPDFAATAPPVLQPILAGHRSQSPLADFATWPTAARLRELAVSDSALAIALRVRLPSLCAAALVAQWQQAPLPRASLAALREMADAFVLAEAARALAHRSAGAELLQIWRPDLPAVAPIRALADGPEPVRIALCQAMAGRDDRHSLALLGPLLLAAEPTVRSAAGAALFRSIGDRIGYDPEWPAGRRTAAVAQLAALIQRTP